MEIHGDQGKARNRYNATMKQIDSTTKTEFCEGY